MTVPDTTELVARLRDVSASAKSQEDRGWCYHADILAEAADALLSERTRAEKAERERDEARETNRRLNRTNQELQSAINRDLHLLAELPDAVPDDPAMQKVEGRSSSLFKLRSALLYFNRLYGTERDRADALAAETLRLRQALAAAEEALEPFAHAAERLDDPMSHARNKLVTFALPGGNDHDVEVQTWPLDDDMVVLDAWRYHDPLPASERIPIAMRHLRAARRARKASEPSP